MQPLVTRRSRNSQRLSIVASGKTQNEWHGVFRPGFGFGIGGGRGAETAAWHLSVDDPWVERDSGHFRRKLLGERLSETFNGEFGSAIGSDFGRGGAAPAGT